MKGISSVGVLERMLQEFVTRWLNVESESLRLWGIQLHLMTSPRLPTSEGLRSRYFNLQYSPPLRASALVDMDRTIIAHKI